MEDFETLFAITRPVSSCFKISVFVIFFFLLEEMAELQFLDLNISLSSCYNPSLEASDSVLNLSTVFTFASTPRRKPTKYVEVKQDKLCSKY